jgi:hypothetical protein
MRIRSMRRPRPNELLNTISFFGDRASGGKAGTLHEEPPTRLSSSSSSARRRKPTQVAQKTSTSGGIKTGRFAKLSNLLEEHAAELKGQEAVREEGLRPRMLLCLQSCSRDDEKLGELLYEYREIYKSGKQWTSIAERIGKAINRSTRTIYRILDRYEGKGKKPIKKPIKALKPMRDGDRRQAKREIAARLAIRVFLENLPDDEKVAALVRALAQEAHQVWGKRDPIALTIHPEESTFTIDGRLRSPGTESEVKAA